MRNPRAIQAEKPCSIRIQYRMSEAMKEKGKERSAKNRRVGTGCAGSPGGRFSSGAVCSGEGARAFPLWLNGMQATPTSGTANAPVPTREGWFGYLNPETAIPVPRPQRGGGRSYDDPRNGYYSLPVRHLREGRLRYVNLLSGAGLVANGGLCVRITHSARFSRRERVFGARDCEEVLMG